MTQPTSEPHLTPDDLRAVAFPMSRGAGYDSAEVDAFLDEATLALEASPDERVSFRHRLDAAQFRVARRNSYDIPAVDALLDRLEIEFNDRSDPVGADKTPVAPPSQFSGDQAREAEELARVSLQPRGSRFRSGGLFASGLQFAAVDELVEQVAFSITVPANSLKSDDIRKAEFPPDQSGYRKKDVQEWLNAVERHLKSRLR